MYITILVTQKKVIKKIYIIYQDIFQSYTKDTKNNFYILRDTIQNWIGFQTQIINDLIRPPTLFSAHPAPFNIS